MKNMLLNCQRIDISDNNSSKSDVIIVLIDAIIVLYRCKYYFFKIASLPSLVKTHKGMNLV